MPSTFEQFKNLHHSDDLFVLPNAWDARSAALIQEMKFPAVATSSAAVAVSLGYIDGEGMPLDHYLFVIARILSVLQVPLTVDLEMGYGRTVDEIYRNIKRCIELGVSGINIEDSLIGPSGRDLRDATGFAETIGGLRERLQKDNLDLFINVRCDTYLLDVSHKRTETKTRLGLYEKAGADGIFLPCIQDEEDIAEAVQHTDLPLNIMCVPGLPGLDVLTGLGVKRVSMGPFLFNKVYSTVTKLTDEVRAEGTFSPLFTQVLTT